MSADLLDTGQVATLLGLAPASVQRMRQPDRPGPPFPPPARYFGRTPVWERADIVAWQKSRPGSGRLAKA